MRRRYVLQLAAAGLVSALTGFTQIGLAQTKAPGGEKAASNLANIHEKLKADKKVIVTKYMD